jgi:hypothetical protein
MHALFPLQQPSTSKPTSTTTHQSADEIALSFNDLDLEIAQVIVSYQAKHGQELTVEAGDVVRISMTSGLNNEWVLAKYSDGRCGIIPIECVEIVEQLS